MTLVRPSAFFTLSRRENEVVRISEFVENEFFVMSYPVFCDEENVVVVE